MSRTLGFTSLATTARPDNVAPMHRIIQFLRFTPTFCPNRSPPQVLELIPLPGLRRFKKTWNCQSRRKSNLYHPKKAAHNAGTWQRDSWKVSQGDSATKPRVARDE